LSNSNNSYDIAKVREAFPVLKNIYYLNTGTYGVMPEPALNKYITIQIDAEHGSRRSNASNPWSRTDETRRQISALIGAVPEEIAFTRNATDGINLVLAGIDWKPGDEVITTTQEHEAMNHPLLYLQKTKGIKARFVEVSPDAQVMLEMIESVYNSKTRLIAMSFVTCETGTRLPAKEICAWAEEHHLLTLFDGAQATGAFPVNMRELGCDFYASNGHKWLCGPKGTGVFFVKKEKVDTLSPAHVGAGSLEKVDLATGQADPWMTAQRFEFGTRAWSLTAGLGCSLSWFESLGWKNVYSYIASLTGYFKQRILERSYLQLLTPIEFEKSSGLTGFVINGHNAGEASRTLSEKWNMMVRVIPHYNAIRISTAHFVSEQDIDKLMEALDSINGEG
jgi:selenocysteine lyase/cysteine desulfurase